MMTHRTFSLLLLLLAAVTLAKGAATGSSDVEHKNSTKPKPGKPAISAQRYNPSSVTYSFYSRNNLTPVTLAHGADLANAPLSATRITKVLIHGFQSSPTKSTLDQAVSKYLSAGDYNVVLVDWSVEANKLSYSEARTDCEWVGTGVAEMLKNGLVAKGGRYAKVHCIGHSLGVHICNRAALATNKAMGRVTGLDPANPLWEPDWAGMKGNALFTDVIHTSNLYADADVYADADFFPNGGKDQPGCYLFDGCDHSRSVKYFLESITSSLFVSRQCNTWAVYKTGACATNPSAIMGERCTTTTRGTYFLATNRVSPYAKG